MTPDDLIAAYPDIPHAVAFVELVFHGPENIWGGLVRRDPAIDPAGMKRCCVVAATGAGLTKEAEILAEMDRPSFLTYLAGKLGYA